MSESDGTRKNMSMITRVLKSGYGGGGGRGRGQRICLYDHTCAHEWLLGGGGTKNILTDQTVQLKYFNSSDCLIKNLPYETRSLCCFCCFCISVRVMRPSRLTPPPSPL